MERRKFIKYTSLTSFGASIFPLSAFAEIGKGAAGQVVNFAAANTQIRHGALNIPFAKTLKTDMPFDWLLDVQQNIFLKDGFTRNTSEDLSVLSLALKYEDEFDALQVSQQNDKTTILWKDQYLETIATSEINQLEIEDPNYKFHLLHIADQDKSKINLASQSDYFIQVLKGVISYDDLELSDQNGLGFVKEENGDYQFEAKEDAYLLIIQKSYSF